MSRFLLILHDGSMFMHILFTLGWHHRALDAQRTIFDLRLFLNSALIPFRGCDGLSNISGSKLMAKMP